MDRSGAAGNPNDEGSLVGSWTGSGPAVLGADGCPPFGADGVYARCNTTGPLCRSIILKLLVRLDRRLAVAPPSTNPRVIC